MAHSTFSQLQGGLPLAVFSSKVEQSAGLFGPLAQASAGSSANLPLGRRSVFQGSKLSDSGITCKIGLGVNRRMAPSGPVQRTKAQASTTAGAAIADGKGNLPLVQHTFGLPTAPGPHFSNTSPMYDVTFTSIDFHRTIGHAINTLILLLPTLHYWNDPRWKFVLLAKLTLPEAVWEQTTHFLTRQLHNVHKFKIIPLLILDAIFFLNGGAQQVLSGPRDGLYWFMIYYFAIFMGGNLIEAFITFFGHYWPIKAPGSI